MLYCLQKLGPVFSPKFKFIPLITTNNFFFKENATYTICAYKNETAVYSIFYINPCKQGFSRSVIH